MQTITKAVKRKKLLILQGNMRARELAFFMPFANAFVAPERRPFSCQSARRWTYWSLLSLVTATFSPPGIRGMDTLLPNVSSSAEKTRPRSSALPSYLKFEGRCGCRRRTCILEQLGFCSSIGCSL